MQVKRSRRPSAAPPSGHDEQQHNRIASIGNNPHRPPKRRRVSPPPLTKDRISSLSDELLLRVFSFFDLSQLLGVSLVSRRFDRLASDSHLWKALYYTRFVLPRAMRIPGFREAGGAAATNATGDTVTNHRLHYAGRRALWADGRRGGIVRDDHERQKHQHRGPRPEGQRSVSRVGLTSEIQPDDEEEEEAAERVDWKRQYRIRHNWLKGKCAVEELKLGDGAPVAAEARLKMLVKVVEGIAITADRTSGLRAWDLRTREMLAQAQLSGGDKKKQEQGDGCQEDGDQTRRHVEQGQPLDSEPAPPPTCLAVDDQLLENKVLDIVVGFQDGSFEAWRLHTTKGRQRLDRWYRRGKSSNGELIAMSYMHPYLLAATSSVLVSLYTFDRPSKDTLEQSGTETAGTADSLASVRCVAKEPSPSSSSSGWPALYLLTSLRSHTSTPPLALSIRKAGEATTIASIAYTFSTRQGWSVGIQDLHIKSSGSSSIPDIASTRLAYTAPMRTGNSGRSHPAQTSPRRSHRPHPRSTDNEARDDSNSNIINDNQDNDEPETGHPTTLCYTHPYLLATLPDNTLVLHLCTSSTSSLSISPGIRLWGHTSGISDAEITSRGRAVSVSTRGNEMRVWELEGGVRSAGAGAGARSVEIRAAGSCGDGRQRGTEPAVVSGEAAWDDERRDWVGFDDEMVIVLKERAGGGESLMVYDFT